MYHNGANAYRQTQVQTAHPAQLVVHLYEGAIRFLERGMQALERQDVAEAHTFFVKVQAIVVELRATLNLDAGPIAEQLEVVYQDLYDRLVAANVRKDGELAGEVLGFLRELAEAWQAVARQVASEVTVPVAPAHQPVAVPAANSVPRPGIGAATAGYLVGEGLGRVR